ncbi:hypothetical protein [Paenibacillus sp.]|uniref:hypothetical protein n=1 Tax=Paenibacillus sp. TaxID=58172 RepID=UPI002810F419|nr:hypothetical protein [Paenibacillus sp.]
MTGALGEGRGAFAASPAIFLAAVVLLSFAVTLVIRDDPAVIPLVVARFNLVRGRVRVGKNGDANRDISAA